jgi:hypothetical protein
VTVYNKHLTSQCILIAQTEQVQDIIVIFICVHCETGQKKLTQSYFSTCFKGRANKKEIFFDDVLELHLILLKTHHSLAYQ